MADRKNTGMRLRPESIARLDAAAERMGGKSRAFVVEVLIGLFADQLNAQTPIPAAIFPSDTRERGRPRKDAGPADVAPPKGKPADAAPGEGKPRKPGRKKGGG